MMIDNKSARQHDFVDKISGIVNFTSAADAIFYKSIETAY
jgi:hypothetical protein